MLFISALLIAGLGLVSMFAFIGGEDYFTKQVVSLGVAVLGFFIAISFDTRILRSTRIVIGLYTVAITLLILLFPFGSTVKGAKSWFRFGGFSFQPSDLAKLALIVTLAKYFTRRHIEIRRIRHIIVSGLYAFVPFLLVFLQPDFGSAIIIFMVWFCLVIVSGISYKHLAIVAALGALSFSMLWFFVFAPYQKDRIMNFLNPLADIRGSGYNAYQSMIAVGSGQVLGKGIGYGTQSRLQYLPEHQTDFIFASFAEEWGYLGTIMFFVLYGLVFWRLIHAAWFGATNFETLFALGTLAFIGTHFTINVGMNMGLLPVTGVPLPFMSYGGSHLLTEFIALGLVCAMTAYRRSMRKGSIIDEAQIAPERA